MRGDGIGNGAKGKSEGTFPANPAKKIRKKKVAMVTSCTVATREEEKRKRKRKRKRKKSH